MSTYLQKRILPLMAMLLLATGCSSRTAGQMWEDTRTAGHYMGRGVRSLFGVHGESRQVKDQNEFSSREPEDFIPFADEAQYQQLTMGDLSSLDEITADSAIPLSKETPGESGSFIPGIDGFSDPSGSRNLSSIFRTVHFPHNSNLIKGRENLEIIKGIARYLKENPNVYIFTEGHCDERGTAAYNLALGARRSNAVRNLLIKEGVNLDRIFTISYGKEKPIDLEHNEISWEKNRRATFRLYKGGRG